MGCPCVLGEVVEKGGVFLLGLIVRKVGEAAPTLSEPITSLLITRQAPQLI